MILPATLTFVAMMAAILQAQIDPPVVCVATNVGLTTLTGTATNTPPSTTWTYSGTSTLSWGCTSGNFPNCEACYKSETYYWNIAYWALGSSSIPTYSYTAACGSTGNTAPLTVTVNFLAAGWDYKTILYATAYNTGSNPDGTSIACGGTYALSTFQTYKTY